MSIGKITLIIILVGLELLWLKCLIEQYRFAIKEPKKFEEDSSFKSVFVGTGIIVNILMIVAFVLSFITANW